MRYFLPLVVVCMSLFGLAAHGAAQTSSDSQQIIAQNPVLAQLAKAKPSRILELLAKLDTLTQGPQQENPPRRGPPPSEAEIAQIKANPILVKTYLNNDIATLALLREINALVTPEPAPAADPSQHASVP